VPNKENIFAIENKNVDKEDVEKFINNLQKRFTKTNDYYESVYINNIKRIKNKKSFNGTVYLLARGRTFSAATYFAALFKNHKRGKIVGEQIGGSHHNITGGKIIEYMLPNTKINVSMPIAVLKFSQEIQTNVSEKIINPDVLVSEKIKYKHFLQKEDWGLQEVFLLINKSTN